MAIDDAAECHLRFKSVTASTLACETRRRRHARAHGDSGARSELGTKRFEITQHPDVSQHALLCDEEGSAHPLDVSASWRVPEEFASVESGKADLCCRTFVLGNQ